MTYKILTVIAVLTASFAYTTTDGHYNSEIPETPKTLLETTNESITLDEKINHLYDVFVEKNPNVPNLKSFKNGMLGYYKLSDKKLFDKEILTIIDFSLSSTKKRMWVLDMKNKKVLFNNLVAHGKNTGGEFATKFSNTVNSLQSSLGFFVTAETYYGGNGYSMFIDGMEEEFNSNARDRYVVVHGAKYANPEFISNVGRLGRSYGCPALPTGLTQEIIDVIKNKSVLYIHSSNKKYAEESKMIRA